MDGKLLFKGVFFNKLAITIAYLVVTFPLPSFAIENSGHSIEQVFSLSLEELLKIEVITPSKTSQSLQETPGVVSVITAREISLFGGRDLGEVLSRVLGFSEYSALNNGRNIVTIRDDQPSPNNSHVLFLLNGIPINRESYAGGIWNEAIITSIPLQAIKRVEVTRGPGSVLYGTNAFAGVVNIITHAPSAQQSFVEFGSGSFNHRQINGFAAGSLGEWNWNSSVRWAENDGWPFKANTAGNEEFEGDAWSNSPGFHGSLSNETFSVNAFWGESQQWTTRGNSFELVGGEITNEKYFVGLSYAKPIDNKWELTSHLSHVGGRTALDIVSATPGEFTTIKYKTDDSRLELQAKKIFSNNAEFILGSTLDYFTGKTPSPTTIVPDWDEMLIGLYGQYELPVGASKYIVGAQYNKAVSSDSVVPRLGYIHQISDAMSFKLLYGQAFRSPYVIERKINVSIPSLSLIGDENLNPEVVTTYDAQLNFVSGNVEAALTLFRNEQKDLIVRQVIGPGSLRFENHGRLSIQGVEFESKYAENHAFVSFNYSYQENKNGDGVENYTLQPEQRFKLGIGYSAERWSIGFFDVFSSAYKDGVMHTPTRALVNEPSKSFHRLTANITYQPRIHKDLKIELYMDNILNKTLSLTSQPGDPLSLINTRPALAGRFIMLSITKSLGP